MIMIQLETTSSACEGNISALHCRPEQIKQHQETGDLYIIGVQSACRPTMMRMCGAVGAQSLSETAMMLLADQLSSRNK